MEQWRKNLYTAWFTQILSLTGFGFVFPFLPLFIQELGTTEPDQLQLWTGLIASAPALSMGLMAPIWGLIADKVGKKIMILRAMLFGSLVSILLSFAGTTPMVFVLRFVQGLFTGTVSAAAALVASGTPRHKLSFALGFQSSSTFIGISLGPLLGGIAAELAGYRASFLIGAAVLAVGFVLALVYIRDPKELEDEETLDASSVPADAGATNTTGPRRGGDAGSSGDGFGIRNFLAPAFVAAFAILFMLRFSRVLTVPFIPLHLQALRDSTEGTSAIVGAVSAARGAATAAAGLTLSRMGDKGDKLQLIALFLLAAMVFSVPVFLAKGMALFVIFNVVFTYFLGGVEPLLQSSLAEMTPSNKRGLLFGIQTTVGNTGWFLAPLAGSGVSLLWSVRHVFAAMTVALAASLVVSVLIRRRMRARQSLPDGSSV
jgi:DHA1 family multidrug resistance protein-like MFS transporter